MIRINRSSAEEITRNRLRAVRDGRLAELDVAYLRALESGEDTATIVADKQALRDVTGKDLSALDLEQLSTLTLDAALAL